MEYTLEQLKQYEDLINKTLQTGTIKHEDKKLLEDFLLKVTGTKVNCMGCNLSNILNILKAYKKKFDEANQTQTTAPVVQPITTDSNNVPNTDADAALSVRETKEVLSTKKAGRPRINKPETL